MTRSYRQIIAAAAFLPTLALAAPSHAAPAKTKSHAIVGTLQKVDDQSITVRTPKGEETVKLVASSRIHRGAATLQPENLTPYVGQRIKVRYVDRNGERQAETVALDSRSKK